MSSIIQPVENSPTPRSLYVLVFFQVLQSIMLAGLSIFRLLENDWLMAIIPITLNEVAKDPPAVLMNGLSFLLIALVLFVLALSMLSRRYTTWLLTIFIQGGLLLYGLVTYVQGNPRYDLMVSGVILVFQLNMNSIQTAFSSNTENAL